MIPHPVASRRCSHRVDDACLGTSSLMEPPDALSILVHPADLARRRSTRLELGGRAWVRRGSPRRLRAWGQPARRLRHSTGVKTYGRRQTPLSKLCPAFVSSMRHTAVTPNPSCGFVSGLTNREPERREFSGSAANIRARYPDCGERRAPPRLGNPLAERIRWRRESVITRVLEGAEAGAGQAKRGRGCLLH
jgi:hypothetical protein